MGHLSSPRQHMGVRLPGVTVGKRAPLAGRFDHQGIACEMTDRMTIVVLEYGQTIPPEASTPFLGEQTSRLAAIPAHRRSSVRRAIAAEFIAILVSPIVCALILASLGPTPMKRAHTLDLSQCGLALVMRQY
jgi:hypothetical protein